MSYLSARLNSVCSFFQLRSLLSLCNSTTLSDCEKRRHTAALLRLDMMRAEYYLRMQ